MKKVLALLALALATLPSRASNQRIWPQYRIGAAELQDNDGRLTVSQAQNGVAYVADTSSLLTTCTVAVASIPAGQQFTRWWYYYLTGTGWSQVATTNETALGTASACTWSYDTKIAAAGAAGVYVVADFDYLTYTLHYNANGGSGSMPDESHIYTNRFNLAANAFTKPGYTFDGWTNRTGTAFANAASIASGAVFGVTYTNATTRTANLYATWKALAYTVTLNPQSGTGGSASVTATYGAAMPSITLPTRTGYTFGGYFTGTNGAGTQYYTAAGKSARAWDKTDATTLYAKWTANTYTVTLNQQNGSGGTSSVTATYAAALPSVTVPTRTGYTFGGYYDQANGGGTQYYTAAGASARNWNKTAATTLYAKWTANTYSVHFNANGGSGTMASQSFTYDVAQALAANAYVRDGYVFGGWTNSTGTAYADVASVSNLASANGAVVDLYAKWTHLWTVVFMDDSLFDSEVISSKAYPNGTSIIQPSAPSHTGYTFKGWAPSVSQTAVADATYVAQYEANKYRVTFHSNYGDDVTNGTMRFTYGESFSIPASISGLTSREGYVLEGWGTTADAETPQYAPAATGVLFEDASAVDLYAVWKPIAYTIVFDGDGAEAGAVDDIAAVYDRAYALPANGFARSGFNFTGWRFGSATYAVGASVSNLTTTAGGTVTFSAVWSELRYAAFDGHGADNAEAMIDDVLTFDGVETHALVSNRFEKTGYTFGGWATNETEAAAQT
ncbi:MAG: InlB B-repeat-containing protein, partial [Kiritimatiellae bacterium]|nr:InlB B-repeat-containing protein [Kiritimatiellia bacterium]